MPATTTAPAELLVEWLPLARKLSCRYARLYELDRDDVLGELLLRAVRTLGRFDPARAKFQTFLGWIARTVASHLCLYRSRMRRAGTVRLTQRHPDPRSPNPLALAIEAEEQRQPVPRPRGALDRLPAALAVLTERQRHAVRARFGIGGMPVHTLREIDPTRTGEANRQAVAAGLAKLRAVLLAG